MGSWVKRLFGINREDAAIEDTAAAWEDRAARFLEGKGLKVVARNVRCRRGEIDILAVDWDEVVFVEVKARRSRAFGGPEYAIDEKKKHRLVSAAKEIAVREKLDGRAMRFDAVLIFTGSPEPEITHITDAFGEKTS